MVGKAGMREIRAFTPKGQVGFLLRRAYQKMFANLSGRIADFGVTPQQFGVLATMREVGPVSQNQLGRLVSMDPAAIHGVIRRLAARGLVRQDADPGDQRRTILSLSAEGEAMVETIVPHAVAAQKQSLSGLSAEERRELIRLLSHLIDNGEA